MHRFATTKVKPLECGVRRWRYLRCNFSLLFGPPAKGRERVESVDTRRGSMLVSQAMAISICFYRVCASCGNRNGGDIEVRANRIFTIYFERNNACLEMFDFMISSLTRLLIKLCWNCSYLKFVNFLLRKIIIDY